ncbi:MAG: amidohydrolase family protein, partial [Firmicutes bacterium]|nr:amidohydrolase family protein [Bacillota bacterium]
MQTYFNFKLIDVVGKRSVPDSFMTVEDGLIKEVGKASELTPGQKNAAVDLKGMTVMPGMFNTHIHSLSSPIAAPESLNWETSGMFALRGLRHLQQHLASGVTFVRDMNGRKLAEVDLKNALKLGLFEGPDLQICRQCLCMTGGHGCNTGRECDGPEDCRKAAREQIKGGADFVKI